MLSYMFLLLLLVVLLLVVVVENLLQHTRSNTFSLPSRNIGRQLDGDWFYYMTPVHTIIVCAQECMYVSKCKSFNYDKAEMSCRLNRLNSTDVSEDKWENKSSVIFSDRNDWPKGIVGSCASEPCSSIEKCIPSNPPKCVPFCGVGYQITNTLHYGCATIGCVIRYFCKPGFTPTLPYYHRTCQTDGTWSNTDTALPCIKLTSCQELKTCNPQYEDGEYWLPLSSFSSSRSVKIYCANMQNGGIPEEYISLPVPSTAEYFAFSSIFKGFYDKIRIDPTTKRVDESGFVSRNTDHCMLRYGTIAVDSDCPMSNYTMTFDMSGTGLLIDPRPEWALAGETNQSITIEYKDSGKKILLVQCDVPDEYHGTVEPTAGIYLRINNNEVLHESVATVPKCF